MNRSLAIFAVPCDLCVTAFIKFLVFRNSERSKAPNAQKAIEKIRKVAKHLRLMSAKLAVRIGFKLFSIQFHLSYLHHPVTVYLPPMSRQFLLPSHINRWCLSILFPVAFPFPSRSFPSAFFLS